MPFPTQSSFIKKILTISKVIQTCLKNYLGIRVASSFRLGVLDNLGVEGLESLGLGGLLESLGGLAARSRRGLGALDTLEEDGGGGCGGRLSRVAVGSGSREGTRIGPPGCCWLFDSASCCFARRVLTASRAVCRLGSGQVWDLRSSCSIYFFSPKGVLSDASATAGPQQMFRQPNQRKSCFKSLQHHQCNSKQRNTHIKDLYEGFNAQCVFFHITEHTPVPRCANCSKRIIAEHERRFVCL